VGIQAVNVSVEALFGNAPEKEESLKPVGALGFFVELLARFELATSSLPKFQDWLLLVAACSSLS